MCDFSINCWCLMALLNIHLASRCCYCRVLLIKTYKYIYFNSITWVCEIFVIVTCFFCCWSSHSMNRFTLIHSAKKMCFFLSSTSTISYTKIEFRVVKLIRLIKLKCYYSRDVLFIHGYDKNQMLKTFLLKLFTIIKKDKHYVYSCVKPMTINSKLFRLSTAIKY